MYNVITLLHKNTTMWTTVKNSPFTIRIPLKTRQDLKFLSSISKRPQASIASEMIQKNVNIQAQRANKIQEAKKQIQQGLWIPHNEVKDWIESLATNQELPIPKAKLLV